MRWNVARWVIVMTMADNAIALMALLKFSVGRKNPVGNSVESNEDMGIDIVHC
jgi:hypothetical protein